MVAVDQVKTSQHGLEDQSLFKAPTLLMHPEMGHVKLDGNTMTCLWSRNPLIIPPTLLVSVFREASKMKGTALRHCVRACASYAVPNGVLHEVLET